MRSLRPLFLAALLSLAGLAPLAAQQGPVAAREIPRGAVIVSADIAGDDATSVLGWTARRMIAQGDPLREPAISPPDVIRSGDQVQLVYRKGAMELRIAGKAMGSARVGEQVMVRVDQKRRYQGTATGPGEVQLEEARR